jgi:REP-associated tyrosine transposase
VQGFFTFSENSRLVVASYCFQSIHVFEQGGQFMGRMPRVHQPGALYHAILRGNNRQAIFFSASDRERWEQLLTKAIDRYCAHIHAYCWMTNHVHLLLQVSDQPLSNIIRFAASQYSRQTNAQLGKTGHLFERRHGAYLVGDDAYLMRLLRYIHNNPVRAVLAPTADDYKWSSHRNYLGRRKSDWLTTDFVLRMFGKSRTDAGSAYRRFMMVPDACFDAYNRQDETTDDSVDIMSNHEPCVTRRPFSASSLDEIISCQIAKSGISISQLTGPGRTRDVTRIRAEIAIQATQQGVATLADVARALGRSESAISQLISSRRSSRTNKP